MNNYNGTPQKIMADMAFDRRKSEKKHARKVIKYENFLQMEESL